MFLYLSLSAHSDLELKFTHWNPTFQLLPGFFLFYFIPASVSLHIFLPQAPIFSFVCFSLLGFHGLCISGVLLMLLLGLGAPLGYLFELLLPLAVCAIAVSFLLSIYLYIRSFWAPSHALALGGNTGESWATLKEEPTTLNYCLKKATGHVLCVWRPVSLFVEDFGIPMGDYSAAKLHRSLQAWSIKCTVSFK